MQPGILQIVHPATQYKKSLAKTIYDQGLRTFQYYQLVQCTLVQQVLEAMEDKYLIYLRNRIK